MNTQRIQRGKQRECGAKNSGEILICACVWACIIKWASGLRVVTEFLDQGLCVCVWRHHSGRCVDSDVWSHERLGSPQISQKAIIPLDLQDGCPTTYFQYNDNRDTTVCDAWARDEVLIIMCARWLFCVKLGEVWTHNLHRRGWLVCAQPFMRVLQAHRNITESINMSKML